MKNLLQKLKTIGWLAGIPVSSEQAKEENKLEFLDLDYNSAYGGYRLCITVLPSHSQKGAFGESDTCGRRSSKEMIAYLDGLHNGILTKKEKTNELGKH